MKTVNVVDRPLTAAELSTISRFAELTGTACFACLGPQICMILPAVEESQTDELLRIARERMAETDDSVDYTRFYMEDGSIIIGIPGGICAMSLTESEGDPSAVLMLRHMAIDACRDGEISAIVFNYN